MVDIKNNTHWEEVSGYFSENRIDSRWILKNSENKGIGNLRIVSHPDLQPGYLKGIFTYVIDENDKTEYEILQTIVDYKMSFPEMEVLSVDRNVKTDLFIHVAPIYELEKLFNVKVFR